MFLEMLECCGRKGDGVARRSRLERLPRASLMLSCLSLGHIGQIWVTQAEGLQSGKPHSTRCSKHTASFSQSTRHWLRSRGEAPVSWR